MAFKVDEIKKCFRAAMQTRGWPEQRLCGLPPTYCKDIPVTPYFFFRTARQAIGASDQVGIHGNIGVIHQAFEREWAQTQMRNPRIHTGLCTGLLVVNVLGARAYLATNNLNDEIDRFADALAGALYGMPQDEGTFRKAVETGRLAGKSLMSFRSGDLAKFDKLLEFVRDRQIPLSY